QPFLRDERKNQFATIGGFLQSFFPALACCNAALGVEIEENIVPAVLGEPVADLDGLVAVEARMTDKKARHSLDRRSSNDLQLDRKSAPDRRYVQAERVLRYFSAQIGWP